MRILHLATRLPWPPSDGAQLHVWHQLSRLARRHQARLLCFADHRDPASIRALAAAGIATETVPRHSRRLRQAFHAVRALLGTTPYLALAYASPAMAAAVRRACAEWRPDIVHAHFLHMSQYLAECGNAIRVLDLHNLEEQIWRRTADIHGNPLARLFARAQVERIARYQVRMASLADRVLTVSPLDAERLRAQAPDVEPVLIPNGVEVAAYTPPPTPPDSDELLFVGSMGWLPNTDAVAWFHRDILPLIFAQRPHAHLTLVGKSPPAHVAQLASQRVTVTGYVDDVRPYLARAAVFVVPLRIGGGTRLKILEAMAAGVPVVSTRIGAEGLEVEHGRHVLLADTPADFAAAVLELLDNPDRRAALAAAARQRAAERYDWDNIVARLEHVYHQAAAERASVFPHR